MDKFEEIRKFKELLDNGIISQDEFDKKKQEVLEAKEPSGAKTFSDFLGGAKEKSEQAKAVAAEKLEELKKKQAEEAEKRRQQEEERKKKEAELEEQKAEQARIKEEEKKKEAENKRLLQEEKQKQKEAKKQQAKQKRKEFFSKKSTKAVIGVICGLIIAFIAFCIYLYATKDTIKNDFSDTTTQTIHDLECVVPSNWTEDTQNVATPGADALESKAFLRYDKRTGDLLSGIVYQYYGDDLDVDSVINDLIGSDWEEYTLKDAPANVKAYKKQGENEYEFYTIANADYSTFVNYLSVASSAYDEDTINAILSAPKYSSYKNKAEVEDVIVAYKGSNENAYTAKKSDFDVSIKYKDKDPKKTVAFDISPPAPVIKSGEITKVKVKCHGVEKDVELKGKQVEKITAKYSGDKEAGVVIKKGNEDLEVKVKWDDGSEETITDYTMDKEIKLEAGKTGEAQISAYGKSTTLKVECSTLTEAQFKDKCKTRDYKGLLRKASYAEYTKISGKVVQDCGGGYYRITSGGSNWDNVYMVTLLSGDTLVEDDWVTCYGVTAGIYSYTTVMGATQKVPWLTAKYADID